MGSKSSKPYAEAAKHVIARRKNALDQESLPKNSATPSDLLSKENKAIYPSSESNSYPEMSPALLKEISKISMIKSAPYVRNIEIILNSISLFLHKYLYIHLF